MNIRYPINLITANIAETLSKMSALLGASKISEVPKGIKHEDVFFIGPYSLVKDLYSKQSDFEKGSLRLIVNENIKTDINERDKKIIASGVYLPENYAGNLPFLILYKRVQVLDGKPILISENYLNPGELVMVPETSELFAVLFYNDGQVCEIPDEVQWYYWFSDKENIETAACNSTAAYRINYDSDYSESDYREGNLRKLETPLLDSETVFEQMLNEDEPVTQVYPVLSDKQAGELLSQLKSCKAWVRRTGENNILYTQETFDILEFSQKPDSPEIFRRLIEKLQSEKLLKVMTKLSGLKLTALREVYAFRMQSNEFITKHADSTLNGQLLVRFNWLLQSPAERKYDLRFWKGKDSEMPVTRYKAIPNSATIFYVGDTTPHDLSPVPENSDKDRYNIVLTFGIK
jgi:hypothetical protein